MKKFLLLPLFLCSCGIFTAPQQVVSSPPQGFEMETKIIRRSPDQKGMHIEVFPMDKAPEASK